MSIDITPEDELTVEPLTEDEVKWIKKLQRLLKACPSERLDLVTIGDPSLTVVDKTHPNYDEISDCKWEGCDLASISFWGGPNVIGMCG